VSRPRIRSIKPEGLQHPKIGMLSDRALRLWFCLVTQVDDEGRLRWRAEHFRFLGFGYQVNTTVEMVSEAMVEIVNQKLAYLYEVNEGEYIELHDWRDHQKIDHFVASTLPGRPARDLAPPRETARDLAPPRGDLDLGSGSDLNLNLAPAPPVPPPTTPPVQAKLPRKIASPADGDKSKGALAFEAYATAYQARYGVAPVRNSQVNSIFKALAELLGKEAPEVAAFFVGRQDSFYVRDKHSPGLLRRDYAKIHTEWATRNAQPSQGTGNVVPLKTPALPGGGFLR
jgi:hypothetical protein